MFFQAGRAHRVRPSSRNEREVSAHSCFLSEHSGGIHMARHVIEGSERQPVEGSRRLHATDPHEIIEVKLKLRRKNDAAYQEMIHKLEQGEAIPAMDRKTFASKFGTS